MPLATYSQTEEEIISQYLKTKKHYLISDFITTVYPPKGKGHEYFREIFEEILHNEFRIPYKQMFPDFLLFDEKKNVEIIDIAVFKNEKKRGQNDIVILVDCRSKNKKQAFQKARRLFHFLPCCYFIWFNGKHRIGWRRKNAKSRIVEEVYKI